MAATIRVMASTSVSAPVPDLELDMLRDAIHTLADAATGSGTIAIARRTTDFLCEEREEPVVPVLLDGRGVLIGPLLNGGAGCPCCAIARREQHGLRSGMVGVDDVLLAKGRTMTVATALLIAAQSLALLKGAIGSSVVREVDPRSMTFRSWQLVPSEDCHCAHI